MVDYLSYATALVANMICSSTADDIVFGSRCWFIYVGVSCICLLFAGLMSGLTLGFMSLSFVELDILQRTGTDTEKIRAAAVLPVLQKQHQLLVTLLLCNAAAMEALPVLLDRIYHPLAAVVLSITFVLFVGEIIPQAICSRYGLVIGANFVWLVRFLMFICYPIASPIAMVLDAVLGRNNILFRRAQLKALVSIHSQEAGRGGELTHNETTIISGTLDLTLKTAEEAMTPIESTFSLDVNTYLDREVTEKFLARGHSRIPVYSGNPKNIVGVLLVKNLLTVRGETDTPLSAVPIRHLPRVPANLPLYDILNEFQKGSTHMAVVVKVQRVNTASQSNAEKVIGAKDTNGDCQLAVPLLSEYDGENVINTRVHNQTLFPQYETAEISVVENAEYGEVIGIITLEDVFEELLQKEIVDETDVCIDLL